MYNLESVYYIASIISTIVLVITLFLSIYWRHKDNNKIIINTYIRAIDDFMFLAVRNNGNSTAYIHEFMVDTLNVCGVEKRNEIVMKNCILPQGDEKLFFLDKAYLHDGGIVCKGTIIDKRIIRHKTKVNIKFEDIHSLTRDYQLNDNLLEIGKNLKKIEKNLDKICVSIKQNNCRPNIMIEINENEYNVASEEIFALDIKDTNRQELRIHDFNKENYDYKFGKTHNGRLILGIFNNQKLYDEFEKVFSDNNEDNNIKVYVGNQEFLCDTVSNLSNPIIMDILKGYFRFEIELSIKNTQVNNT